jgi:hypothetical protein
MVVIAEQENAQSIDWLDESEVEFERLHQRMRKVPTSYRRSPFLSYLIHQIGSNSQNFQCIQLLQFMPNQTKCNQEAKYIKRNLIFTSNFGGGGGAGLVDGRLGGGV